MNNSKDVSEAHLSPCQPARTLQKQSVKSKKCPIFYSQKKDSEGMDVEVKVMPGYDNLKPPEEFYIQGLCELTGTENGELAKDIIGGASAICGHENYADKINVVLQSLAEQQPNDLNEARLCIQAAALYSQGMNYLERARDVLFDSGTFAKQEWHAIFMKTAVKLLDLHTKTISELSRYKQKGEQRIVVQHVQVNDGGQAIVGGVLNSGGGKQ